MSRISDIIRMRTSSAIYKTFTHIEIEGRDWSTTFNCHWKGRTNNLVYCACYYVVTSIKQTLVLKGHLFSCPVMLWLWDVSLFQVIHRRRWNLSYIFKPTTTYFFHWGKQIWILYNFYWVNFFLYIRNIKNTGPMWLNELGRWI